MKQYRNGVVVHHVQVTVCWVPEIQHQHTVYGVDLDLPPGTSPPSKLDPGPFEVHSKG